MGLRLIIILTFILSSQVVLSQKNSPDLFKIVFYNVENLFDTLDNPLTMDEEFLPDSRIAWNSERYWHKIQNTARVLMAIDSVNLPGIIGLAEIENKSVLEDLILTTGLKHGNYDIIIENGQDPRGINVALLFRKNIFRQIDHQAIPSALSFKTRDILYVRLLCTSGDTFHVFINHWKSRQGGAQETEIMRIENAETLKRQTDSVLSVFPQAKLIIMGDFNDEPGDKSIAETLGIKKPGGTISSTGLYNLLYDHYEKGEGTLYYKDWDVFDQIIVSGNLLLKKKGKKPFILPVDAHIFKPDWLLYRNKNGELVPNRTAGSKEYFGGFSDHLPVYTTVRH